MSGNELFVDSFDELYYIDKDTPIQSKDDDNFSIEIPLLRQDPHLIVDNCSNAFALELFKNTVSQITHLLHRKSVIQKARYLKKWQNTQNGRISDHIKQKLRLIILKLNRKGEYKRTFERWVQSIIFIRKEKRLSMFKLV